MATYRPNLADAYLPKDFGRLLIAGVNEQARAVQPGVSIRGKVTRPRIGLGCEADH